VVEARTTGLINKMALDMAPPEKQSKKKSLAANHLHVARETPNRPDHRQSQEPRYVHNMIGGSRTEIQGFGP